MIPYQADLSPEERGRALVRALRGLPADKPITLSDDSGFLWCYAYELLAPKTEGYYRAASDIAGAPEGWCGTIGCAVGLGICLGLLHETSLVAKEDRS